MKVLNEQKLGQMAQYIKNYMHDNNGEAPKFKQILEHMQMSKSVGYRYLMVLKERGVVNYSGKGTLSMDGAFTARSEVIRVAVLGSIPCGTPEDEVERVEGYIGLPEEWDVKDGFLLRAYGDSMVDAGICEGDLVFVKRGNEARSGQIVVALTEEGSTLKRIFWDGERPRLHAENSTYPPHKRDIYPRSLEIQGVVKKLIKDFE